jgi:hypothetical protein
MEHYFSAQRDNIFRNVEVLIYVFDVESREIDKDIHYYQSWYLDFLIQEIRNSKKNPDKLILVWNQWLSTLPKQRYLSSYTKWIWSLKIKERLYK